MKIFNVEEVFRDLQSFHLNLFSKNSNSNKDKNENEKKTENSLIFKQCLVASGPLLLTVGLGMTSGYSAILLPQLQTNNSTIQITQNESSWIASLAALPMALGCLLGGYSMEKFGRKSSHLLTIPPNLLGWLLIFLSKSFHMLCWGRFLTGLSAGLLAPITGVYISETSSPQYRGILLASISLAVSLGLFFVHILGTFLQWQITALISCLIPLISLFLLILVPESPSWLIKQNRIDEGLIKFKWCRGNTVETQKEFDEIVEKQQNEKLLDNTSSFSGFLVRDNLLPLGIMVVFIVSNQWAGVNAITFYTIDIINKTFAGTVNDYLAMLLIDLIRLVMSFVACYLLKKIKRRPLALASGIGTSAALFLLSLCTFSANYLMDNKESTILTSISMTALIAYISFITIGFVPLPWAMMGEVFPLKHRNIGTSICSFMAFLAFFSVVKTTPGMFDGFGTDGTFFVYGVVAGSGTVFIYYFLPETKDRTLNQIEEQFNGSK